MRFLAAFSAFFIIVPPRFRSARKRPTGAKHRKNHMIFMVFQGALSHRRRQQGQENATKKHRKPLPKNAGKRSFFIAFRVFPRCRQKSFKKLQKVPPGRPKWAPGVAPEAPRAAPERPRGRQERPKSAPGALQKDQKRIKKCRRLDFGPRKASGRLPGAILE